MPPGNKGYDIESVDKYTGELKYIEVKGQKFGWGERGVGMTYSQFWFAKEKGKASWLYVVEDVDSDNPTIYRFNDPANMPNDFRFDSNWKELAHKDKEVVTHLLLFFLPAFQLNLLRLSPLQY